ncbi:Fungal specific transcription factor, partial [Ascosphaera acerosa]
MTGAVSNGKRKAGTVAIEDAAGHLTSRHLGLASDVEPLLLHYLPPGPRQECHLLNSCLRRVAPNEADASAIPGPVFVDELDVRRNYNVLQRSHTISLDAIENLVAPCGPALLDVFFAKVHPLCPVLVERSFRAAYDVYVSSTHCHGGHPAGQKQHAGADAPRARREDITPALLAAVYLVSLPYLGEQEGTTSTAASTPLQGCPPQYEAARPDISRLMLLTSQLLTESLALAHHWPLLTTLQAGVLAAQHPELNTPMLISQLVALTFDLGLHVDCGGWAQSGMSDVQRGARRRLAWSVYALDKWASTVHGRPYLIRDDEWGVAGLCLDDFV